jgi:hypothetical protein
MASVDKSKFIGVLFTWPFWFLLLGLYKQHLKIITTPFPQSHAHLLLDSSSLFLSTNQHHQTQLPKAKMATEIFAETLYNS